MAGAISHRGRLEVAIEYFERLPDKQSRVDYLAGVVYRIVNDEIESRVEARMAADRKPQLRDSLDRIDAVIRELRDEYGAK